LIYKFFSRVSSGFSGKHIIVLIDEDPTDALRLELAAELTEYITELAIVAPFPRPDTAKWEKTPVSNDRVLICLASTCFLN
jgi:hypothetical protein